jgi:hypothetical protein
LVLGDGRRPGHEDPLRNYLNSPPDWLARQLKFCREDPKRYLKPTATSLACEVFGSAHRHEEALAAIKEYLEQSA